MKIWAIGDLHFSFGIKGKEMDIFGPEWKMHYDKIKHNWDLLVASDDLVLIPGDISWAMHAEDALLDLQWIDERPGIKVMIKGNHDYWWHSASKVRKVLPKSIHIISNDAFFYNDVAIGGTRLWDCPGLDFSSCIVMKEVPNKELRAKQELTKEDIAIFEREVARLQTSVNMMKKEAKIKIVMTHYPPIGLDLQESVISKMMEEAQVQHVVFGHLHSLKPGLKLFGERNGVHYHLTSCDYLGFTLLQVV